MSKGKLLIVDDELSVRDSLGKWFREEGYEVATAENASDALTRMAEQKADLALLDIKMRGTDGIELQRRLHEIDPSLSVIIMTGYATVESAIEAMKNGAYDYLKKPLDPEEVSVKVHKAISEKRTQEENVRLRETVAEVGRPSDIVGQSAAMQRIFEAIETVGPTDATVLINGESGTGKERVAEAIVRASLRAERPFIRFNCATLTAELAEAELFGHTKGAFTGAQRNRSGLFREAHGGTLLLDEIGELDLNLQAKLLRVLQEGEVRPVGEDRAFAVDVRIIAATHRDLVESVKAGQFRDDLYYRLKVVSLTVPPLRERPEDIPVLARHFLQRVSERFGTGPLHVPPELFERLSVYDWPGNVRELENAIEALVALSLDGELELSLLPGQPVPPSRAVSPIDAENTQGLTLKQRVEAYERGLIVTALEAAGGNRREAAQRLGLSRATLHDKVHRYGIATRTDEE